MRRSLTGSNRVAIILIAALCAGCSNATPTSQTLPLASSGAAQLIEHERSGHNVAAEFAYVTNFGSKNVTAYSVAANGALTPLAGSPVRTGTEPWDVVIDPTGEFAYVTNRGSNNVSAFTIDAASGALKKVKGSPFAAGTAPVNMAVDPSGRFAYVPNVGSNNISAYTIDATSGALTPMTGSPFSAGRGADAAGIDPSGNFRRTWPTSIPTRFPPTRSMRSAAH